MGLYYERNAAEPAIQNFLKVTQSNVSMPKFSIDCKWHALRNEHHDCNCPEFKNYDVVTGASIRVSAHEMRKDESKCAKSGRRWEQKT
jgi:hypothetical protein